MTLIVLEGFISLAHEEHVGRQSLVKISTFGLVEVVWSKGNLNNIFTWSCPEIVSSPDPLYIVRRVWERD